MNLLKTIGLNLLLLTVLGFVACQSGEQKKQTSQNSEPDVADKAFYHHTILKYAKGFEINILDNNLKELIVWDPWNEGKVFQKYYLKNRRSI